MQDEAIQVHTGALRGCAADLADTGYRLGHGLQALPGLTVAAPQWQAAAALATLESAVHGYLTALGERAAQASTGLRAAAEAYEAVDERAAGRLKRWR
ncbi:MAG TPA: type VII secretion target [Micromonosporaceae bacterium]|nr:type VII secretion target [Micromonosporaceae bacterium]